MDYLKILHEDSALADEFDSIFDFFLLDELTEREDADGRLTFSLPGMAFAKDASGGEYHLLEYGQKWRSSNLKDYDMDSWHRISDAFGISIGEELAPVLERFHKATKRQPLYQCFFHGNDGSLTESDGLLFE